MILLATLYTNNFSKRDSKGNPFKYCRLFREELIQNEYKKIFKMDGFNWQSGHICSEYWNTGQR